MQYIRDININYSSTSASDILFGKSASGKPFLGSIDLNETYIKVNNQMWFGSQMQLTSANPNIYLQSSGTQYIDTGIKSSSSLSVEIDYKSISSANLLGYFGTIDGINKSFSIAGMNATPFLRIGTGTASGNTAYSSNNYNHLTMANNFSACTINGNAMTTDGNMGSSTFTNGDNIWFFGINGNNLGSFDIKNVKIYDNNILIRHFVPVPQGLVIGNFIVPSNGMFDIVEQKFYGNLGTGDFIYGNDDFFINHYDFNNKWSVKCQFLSLILENSVYWYIYSVCC